MTPLLPPTHQNNTRTGKSAVRFSPTWGWLTCFRANNHCSTQEPGPKHKTHTNIKIYHDAAFWRIWIHPKYHKNICYWSRGGHQNSGLKLFASSCSTDCWTSVLLVPLAATHFVFSPQAPKCFCLKSVTEQLSASWQPNPYLLKDTPSYYSYRRIASLVQHKHCLTSLHILWAVWRNMKYWKVWLNYAVSDCTDF